MYDLTRSLKTVSMQCFGQLWIFHGQSIASLRTVGAELCCFSLIFVCCHGSMYTVLCISPSFYVAFSSLINQPLWCSTRQSHFTFLWTHWRSRRTSAGYVITPCDTGSLVMSVLFNISLCQSCVWNEGIHLRYHKWFLDRRCHLSFGILNQCTLGQWHDLNYQLDCFMLLFWHPIHKASGHQFAAVPSISALPSVPIILRKLIWISLPHTVWDLFVNRWFPLRSIC